MRQAGIIRKLRWGLLLWPAWAGAFNVTFINPGSREEPYWGSAAQAMDAAAHDLDINLEVLFANRDALRMIELTREVAARSKKPNFLILVNERQAALPMMSAAEQAGIDYFLTYNTLTSEQRKIAGQPRQHYKHWLGSLVPDNTYAGEISARSLLAAAAKLPKQNKPHKLVIVAGDKLTPASIERVTGLRKVLDSKRARAQVQIIGTVYGQWKREQAQEQMNWLLARDPDLDLVWTASDLMAFGAIDSLAAHGKQAGRDTLVATINNGDEAMRARQQGKLSVLVAGHFLTGAYALVMLYDYQHQVDFKNQGLEIRQPLFSLVDESLARIYLERFAGGKRFAHIDFRRFSRYADPKMTQYRFTFDGLLKR
jgi:ABC-type sugar transport system substrate-binding protein